MIKTLIKYLLFLYFLLLCGYGQLSAHTYESTFYSPINNLKGSENASFDTLQHDQAFINKSSSSGTEKIFKIDFTEIEIEEEEKFESSNSFTVILCALILGYFFRYINNGLLFCKHFFYISSNRWHLILQVFRI